MLPPSLAFFTLCLFVADTTHSLRVPFQARTTPYDLPATHRLYPRVNTTVAVKSQQNTQYVANITIGGADFAVILDTGSSDLWITGNVPNKRGLGKSAQVTYAVGQAAGEITTAEVIFSGLTVPEQAFIYVQDASSTGIDSGKFNGLLGLGPSSASSIRDKLDDASGNPFLDQVFRQNTSTPNFITFLLDRTGDSGDPFPGQLTIGELVPTFESIKDKPKSPVKALSGAFKRDQHWSGLIDAIIGPDGQNIELDSLVVGTDKGKLVCVYDSGFTLPQVERGISDKIYGRVPGAEFNTESNVWTVPCDQEVNVTIVIEGEKYPIHPLDTVSSDLNPNGVCVGTFQPISTALDGTFDCIMGMAVLRNTYTLINFGDFVDGNPQNQGDPFMQFLSVTDPAEAHKDYVKLRMNNVDKSGDSSHTLLPPDQGKQSPSSTGEKAKNAFFRYWPWLVGGLGLIILVGIMWLIFRCCCRRGPKSTGAGGFKQGGFKAGPYRQLHEPAPAPAMDLHTMGPPPHHTYADPYYSHT